MPLVALAEATAKSILPVDPWALGGAQRTTLNKASRLWVVAQAMTVGQ